MHNGEQLQEVGDSYHNYSYEERMFVEPQTRYLLSGMTLEQEMKISEAKPRLLGRSIIGSAFYFHIHSYQFYTNYTQCLRRKMFQLNLVLFFEVFY